MESFRWLGGAAPLRRLFLRRGEQRLKLRVLFVARHGGHFDLPESGLVEKMVQVRFREPKPHVGVKFASLFKLMLHKVQDRDPAARTNDAIRGGDRTRRPDRMMQRLTE